MLSVNTSKLKIAEALAYMQNTFNQNHAERSSKTICFYSILQKTHIVIYKLLSKIKGLHPQCGEIKAMSISGQT